MCFSCEFSGGKEDFQFYTSVTRFRDSSSVPNLYYIGVEIEKEYVGREDGNEGIGASVEAVTNEFFTNSEDGSLSEGIEFQSMPATFAYHRKLATNGYYDKFFKVLSDNDLQSRASAGSHVHVSKNAISPTTFKKMAKLMYSVFSNRFVRAIARRTTNIWCERDGIDFERVANGSRSSKYLALNNQYNRSTYEFRIWNSPSSTSELMEQIEFVVALKQYAKATRIDRLTQLGFRRYVASRQAKFGNIHRRIENDFVATTPDFVAAT